MPLTLSTVADPTSVLYDPHNGLIYVANGYANVITAYTPSGTQVSLTGAWANANGPGGLAFDPHTNEIFVANFSGTITAYDENGDQQPLNGFAVGYGAAAIAVVP